MATHSSILAWRIPWTEELAGCSPWGCRELDTTERLSTHTHVHTHSHTCVCTRVHAHTHGVKFECGAAFLGALGESPSPLLPQLLEQTHFPRLRTPSSVFTASSV